MDDAKVGAALRAVRLRRGWRQIDVAARAGVSSGTVSNLERGRLGGTSLVALRHVAAILDVRIDVIARWHGGELDRLLNARHSYLAAAVVELLGRYGWQVLPEVSFSVYGERGFVDLLAWHPPSRSLLVIELKTEIVDAGEMLGVLDRKSRLGARIAGERGWDPLTVSTWLVIAGSSTNRARAKKLEAILRAALPTSSNSLKAWLRAPAGRVAAYSFFQNSTGSSSKRELAGRQRVRRPRSSVAQAPAIGSRSSRAA